VLSPLKRPVLFSDHHVLPTSTQAEDNHPRSQTVHVFCRTRWCPSEKSSGVWSSLVVLSRLFWLVQRHLVPSIPPLPAKNPLARFRPAFLDRRRRLLQYWLASILLHPEIGGVDVVKEWVINWRGQNWNKIAFDCVDFCPFMVSSIRVGGSDNCQHSYTWSIAPMLLNWFHDTHHRRCP